MRVRRILKRPLLWIEVTLMTHMIVLIEVTKLLFNFKKLQISTNYSLSKKSITIYWLSTSSVKEHIYFWFSRQISCLVICNCLYLIQYYAPTHLQFGSRLQIDNTYSKPTISCHSFLSILTSKDSGSFKNASNSIFCINKPWTGYRIRGRPGSINVTHISRI